MLRAARVSIFLLFLGAPPTREPLKNVSGRPLALLRLIFLGEKSGNLCLLLTKSAPPLPEHTANASRGRRFLRGTASYRNWRVISPRPGHDERQMSPAWACSRKKKRLCGLKRGEPQARSIFPKKCLPQTPLTFFSQVFRASSCLGFNRLAFSARQKKSN